MGFSTRILALLFLTVVSACATAPDAPVTDIRSLGIVSTLGDEFEVISVGTTVFQNADSKGDINEWTLDEIAISEVKRQLADRYSIIDIDYDGNGIITDYRSDMSGFWNPKFDLSGSLRRNVPMLTDDSDAPSPHNVDAILIIAPAMLNSYGLRGSPELIGPGMYAGQFITRNTILYIGAQMILVDGKTLAEKRRRTLLPGKINTKDGYQKCYDCFARSVDNELFAKTFDQFTPDQKESVREEIIILLKDGIEYTLGMMGLTETEDMTESADPSLTSANR